MERGQGMAAVTVSSKYQIVIPREIRKSMDIRPGHKIDMVKINNHIVLVPVRDIKEMRGFLKGIDTEIEREEEDRL